MPCITSLLQGLCNLLLYALKKFSEIFVATNLMPFLKFLVGINNNKVLKVIMDLSDIDGSDCHSTNQKEILKEFRRPLEQEFNLFIRDF